MKGLAMYQSRNLEIHVVDHCNLDCIGCSHESPLMPRRCEDPVLLQRALTLLWQYYRAPLVKLLGGEPLLHPAIDEIISAAKMSTGAKVRLVTNGTLLQRRYKLLRGVDEIHISLYASAKIPDDDVLRYIAAELTAPITVQAFGQFRWHRSLPRTDPRITKQVFSTCQMYHSWECHTLRAGRLYPCPPAATWGSESGEGINLLDDRADREDQLRQLFCRNEPLTACNECLGSAGQLVKHEIGWRRRDNKPRDQAVDTDFVRVLQLDANANNQCFEYLRTIHPNGDVHVC